MENISLYSTDARMQERLSRWENIRTLAAGCEMLAGIEESGGIRYDSLTYVRTEFWHDLVALSADKYHSGVLFGLKADSTCVISKAPFAGFNAWGERFYGTNIENDGYARLHARVHSLTNVVQIVANDGLFVALDKDGFVHAIPYGNIPIYQLVEYGHPWKAAMEVTDRWKDVRQILLVDHGLVIGQKTDGEVVAAGALGDLFGTFGRKGLDEISNYKIVDACGHYGGESMHFAFLDSDGIVHGDHPVNLRTEGRYKQIVGLDHTFAGLREDGKVVFWQQSFEADVSEWPRMREIVIGRKTWDKYDELVLTGITEEKV